MWQVYCADYLLAKDLLMSLTDHPKTGHPCHTPKAHDDKLPEDITIEIKRSRCFKEADFEGTCNKGQKGCFVDHDEDKDNWYAELSGYVDMGDGRLKVWAQLTHGFSVVHAAQAAAEVAKLCYEECKEPGTTHCYCRDITHSLPGGDDVNRAVECCLCKTCMPTFAFEGEPDAPTPPGIQAIIDAAREQVTPTEVFNVEALAKFEGVEMTEGDDGTCPCGERFDVPHHHDS